MEIYNVNDTIHGWFIGDFDKAVHRTKDFEVSYMQHPKGEEWPKHHHKIAKEINCLIKGRMLIDGKEINRGDIFIIEPGESTKPNFLEDCELIVVKVPSCPTDKYVDE